MRSLPTALVLGSILCHVGRAQAQTASSDHSAAAAVCVPRHLTLQQQKFHAYQGSYEFKPNEVGTLEFNCPLPLALDTWTRWLVQTRANDPDGDAWGSYVQTAFVRRHKITGQVDWGFSNPPNGAGNWNCGFLSGSGTVSPPVGSPCFVQLDRSTYHYWIEVIVYRGSASAAVRFNGLQFLVAH